MKIGNVLSCFDGMSCTQLALDRAGIEYGNYYASEIKKHAIKVTQDNYPNTIQIGDVCKVNGSDLPEIELMTFGSPCQDFSSANSQRLGLAGAKSSLFYEALRLLHEVKPKYFLMENVRMNGRDYEIISRELGTYPVNINSSLVSAQLRNRFYWTNIGPEWFDLFGFRHSIIPQPKDLKINLKDILEDGFTDREKSMALLSGNDSRPHTSKELLARRYFVNNFGTVIWNNKDDFERIKKNYAKSKPNIVNELVKTGNFCGRPRDREKAFSNIGKIGALLAQDAFRMKIFNDSECRILTQTELERLQTVPEGYTKSVTRNQAANLLGDGWTIDVISHIFSFLKK